jgi:hypothetical protein
MRFLPEPKTMLYQMEQNHFEKWKPIRGDTWDDFDGDRDYGWHYGGDEPQEVTEGWFFNPYKLQTAYLGLDDGTDAKFEWHMTFILTPFIDSLVRDRYVTVNLAAQTITEGGVVTGEVTRLYLYKEMFTRQGSYGYYHFRYQSNNGVGNRESLRIWSDNPIAIQEGSLKQAAKGMTERRTFISTQARADVEGREAF